MTRSSASGPSARRSRPPPARSSSPSAPSCRTISPATAPAPRPPSRPSRGSRRWRGCSRSPRCSTIPRSRFDFPNPDELRPPLITLDMASVGYGDTPVLQRLNLRLDPGRPHRAARPQRQRQDHARPPARGPARADGRARWPRRRKMRVGYFTQYQVEELRQRRHAARAYDAADEGRDAGGGARASSAGSASRARRRRPRSASSRAASGRGWRWR